MSDTGEPEDLEIADELIAERRSGDPGNLPDDMPPWMAIVITNVDTFSYWIGQTVCWLTVPLFGAMVYEVTARYLFIAPTVWAFDVSRMLYGAMFMLGAGYALMRGVHIRADFIYRNWSPRTQGMVDAFLYVVFYFPAMIFFFWVASEFAFDTWRRGELAMQTSWMPHLGPINTSLPVGILFLIIQGISELLKSCYAISKNRWPIK
ncbi:MAG: TRAP transporter small permease subunit [Alphaproteobacteria bacterium]|nr:TRAP transporter small permease subunit [Alphaproteobacteria bacterium]